MRENVELKPCKFCGGKARIIPYKNCSDKMTEGFVIEHVDTYNENFISCPVANNEGEGIGLMVYATEEEAASDWNKAWDNYYCSDYNEELELYKLIVCPDMYNKNFYYVADYEWVENQFFVFVYYERLNEFFKGLKKIFKDKTLGNSSQIKMYKGYVYINLSSLLKGCINLNNIFNQ